MTSTSLSLAHSLLGHQEPVRLVAFGPDGLMVTADVDMQVIVWRDNVQVTSLDMRSENPRHRPHDRLRSAVFDETGDRLFLSAGTRLEVVSSVSGEQILRYHAPEFWPFMLASPQGLALDSDGGLVASFDNGSFEKWSKTLELCYRRKNREAPVWFGVDGVTRRMVGTDGHTLTTWDLETGSRIQRQPLDDHAYNFVYNARTGVAMVRYADKIVLWHAMTLEVIDSIPLPPSPPVMAMDAEGEVYAYACGPDVCLRWSGTSREVVVPADGLRFVCLSFDAQGRLWAGRSDGQVHCWTVG